MSEQELPAKVKFVNKYLNTSYSLNAIGIETLNYHGFFVVVVGGDRVYETRHKNDAIVACDMFNKGYRAGQLAAQAAALKADEADRGLEWDEDKQEYHEIEYPQQPEALRRADPETDTYDA